MKKRKRRENDLMSIFVPYAAFAGHWKEQRGLELQYEAKGKKKTEIVLTASVLKKDPKQTRD